MHANAAQPLIRSMWVSDARNIAGDEAATRDLIDFCGERRIRAAFVWAPELPRDDYARWQAFISACHVKRIAVHAVAGEPAWADKPQLPLSHVAAVVSYNYAAPTRARFDGIQHDVNFSRLDRYADGTEADRASVVSTYLEAILASRDAVRKLGSRMKYGVTMPPGLREDFEWRRARPGTLVPELIKRPLYAHIMESTNYTIITAFHDDAEAVAKDVQEEVRYATRHGKIVYLGVLTGTPEGYSDDMTFAQEGWRHLESALSALARRLGPQRGFRGFAFHDYASCRALGP